MMTGVAFVALFADGLSQLLAPAPVTAMMREVGFPPNMGPLLGSIMVGCAALYALPATAVLGAIMVTGFLGGAICAHVRLGEVGSPPEILSIFLGMIAWSSLYLRDPRLREVLPLVRR